MHLLVSPCAGLLYRISKLIFSKLISLLLFEQAVGIAGWWKPSPSVSRCQDTSVAADSGVECQNRVELLSFILRLWICSVYEKHRAGSFDGNSP